MAAYLFLQPNCEAAKLPVLSISIHILSTTMCSSSFQLLFNRRIGLYLILVSSCFFCFSTRTKLVSFNTLGNFFLVNILFNNCRQYPGWLFINAFIISDGTLSGPGAFFVIIRISDFIVLPQWKEECLLSYNYFLPKMISSLGNHFSASLIFFSSANRQGFRKLIFFVKTRYPFPQISFLTSSITSFQVLRFAASIALLTRFIPCR